MHGFTLVQLAGVLAVMVLLCAVVVPDFIASRRVGLAERAIRDMAAVLDAARWFYVGSSADPFQQRWPGANAADCSPRGGEDTLQALRAAGQLSATFDAVDPWGNRYSFGTLLAEVEGEDVCLFEVRAERVPATVHAVFVNNLPRLGLAPTCAGDVCVARLPPPGREAAFRVTNWTPPSPTCTPSCAGRECGPDPECGRSCGSCAANEQCDAAGRCQCIGACEPGSTSSAGCSSAMLRYCSSTCTLSECMCSPTAPCASGATRSQACGNCSGGTQSQTCQADCTWPSAWGACTGDGCAPGSSTSSGCPAGQSKSCSSACTYGACRCTSNAGCGTPTYGAWSSCSTATCTKSRSVTTPTCTNGGCSNVASVETQSCTPPGCTICGYYIECYNECGYGWNPGCGAQGSNPCCRGWGTYGGGWGECLIWGCW
jgi:hypothetical protein